MYIIYTNTEQLNKVNFNTDDTTDITKNLLSGKLNVVLKVYIKLNNK